MIVPCKEDISAGALPKHKHIVTSVCETLLALMCCRRPLHTLSKRKNPIFSTVDCDDSQRSAYALEKMV
jgi:hypothetical protein